MNPDLIPDTGAPCANCGHDNPHHGSMYLEDMYVEDCAGRHPCWFPGCDCRDFEEAA